MKKKIFIIALVILAGYILLMDSGIMETEIFNDGQGIENQKEETIKHATEFKLEDLEGNEVSLSDFTGRKIFLNFWTTWCPPCDSEMPHINEVYKENHDIEIITINLKEDVSTIKKYMDNNKFEFPVLLDIDSKVSNHYKAYSIPKSVLIDEEGNIIDTHIGAMDKEKLIEFMQIDTEIDS